MVYKFFDKKSVSGSGVATLANKSAANNEIKENRQIAKELHKTIIRNFKKRTVYSRFKDNVWVADLTYMQLISKLNKEFTFYCALLIFFSKYAWVVPLKHKKAVNIVNTFQKILNNLARKPNKIWIQKGSEFYNNSF